jgi:hypothetical protein
MEQYRNLEKDLMLIDPHSREPIRERACVAILLEIFRAQNEVQQQMLAQNKQRGPAFMTPLFLSLLFRLSQSLVENEKKTCLTL